MKNKDSIAGCSQNHLIIYDIGRLYVLLDNYLYNRAYREFNINTAKFNVLMVVKHIGKNNGLSQAEIGNNLYVSAANITKLIDGLEKSGLVVREASSRDRRINLIKISEKGSKLLDQVWIKHTKALGAILETFSTSNKDKLKRLLEKFRKEMEEKTK